MCHFLNHTVICISEFCVNGIGTEEESVNLMESMEEPEKDTSAVEVTAMQEEMEYGREQIVGQEFVASKVTVEEMEREVPTFKLCGDNIDKSVKRRYMRCDKGNHSLHYFHSYAALDRIDLSGLSDEILPGCLPDPEKIASSLLPSVLDDTILKQKFSVLISRILARHFSFFTFTFDDAVRWHIKHKFSNEMSRKSTTVSCNVQSH